MSGQKPPRLALSMKDAAEVLGVTYSVLQDWVREGLVPHFRVGRRVMFRISSLDQWAQEREVPARDSVAYRVRGESEF